MAHFIDFHVGTWRVGSVESSSGVFVGQNLQYGWRNSSKDNSASPSMTGDYNRMEGGQNQIVDPDMLDTWVQKLSSSSSQLPPSPQLQRYWNRRRKHRMSLDDWDW